MTDHLSVQIYNTRVNPSTSQQLPRILIHPHVLATIHTDVHTTIPPTIHTRISHMSIRVITIHKFPSIINKLLPLIILLQIPSPSIINMSIDSLIKLPNPINPHILPAVSNNCQFPQPLKIHPKPITYRLPRLKEDIR